jgi:hypothetical protein
MPAVPVDREVFRSNDTVKVEPVSCGMAGSVSPSVPSNEKTLTPVAGSVAYPEFEVGVAGTQLALALGPTVPESSVVPLPARKTPSGGGGGSVVVVVVGATVVVVVGATVVGGVVVGVVVVVAGAEPDEWCPGWEPASATGTVVQG